MDELSKLFGLMEAQETRLLGIAHCIVPKEEIPLVESVFAQQPLPTIPESIESPILRPESELLKALLPNGSKKQSNGASADTDTNELESVTPPNDVLPVIISSLANSGMPLLPDESVKAIITTTTTETNGNFDENNLIPTLPPMLHKENETSVKSLNFEQNAYSQNDSLAEIVDSTTKSDTIFVSATTVSSLLIQSLTITTTPKPQVAQIPSTSPSIAEIILEEIVSQNPEPDNYIYETFSPVSKTNIDTVSNVQRTDHLVLAEEPPEPIPNDAVLAA